MWGVTRFAIPARRTAPSPCAGASREAPLPYPLPVRVRILPREGRGELDPTRPVLKATPVLLPNALEMPGQIRLHHLGQHRHPILVALARTYHDLVAPEVHVLDAQAAALEQAQP